MEQLDFSTTFLWGSGNAVHQTFPNSKLNDTVEELISNILKDGTIAAAAVETEASAKQRVAYLEHSLNLNEVHRSVISKV